ncbi:MAG: FAD-binding protein, partial [Burkholderiales bacterium]|nr:FAD-binding protein [Burkholderiales bacterium]
YVNFGFWDVVRPDEPHPPGHFNRLVERKVHELGGIKSLYSDSYFTPEEFWATYDRAAYAALKAKYDPGRVFKDLYEKTVLGQ